MLIPSKFVFYLCKFVNIFLYQIQTSATALRCYDCKVPNQECLLNYQNKITDCDNEFISGAISTVTGHKKVCVKYAAGK